MPAITRLTLPALAALAAVLAGAPAAPAATRPPYRVTYTYDHNDYATDGHGHVIPGHTLLRYGNVWRDQVIINGKILRNINPLKKIVLTEQGETASPAYQVWCTAEITPDINCQGDTDRQFRPIPLAQPYLATITPARLTLTVRTAKGVRLTRVRITHPDLHVRRPDRSFVNLPAGDHNVRCQGRHLCRVTLTNATSDWTAHNVRDPDTGQVAADYPVHRVITWENALIEAAPERSH